MGKDQNATTIDVTLIRETMETNLYGLIETTKAFLPLLRKSTTGAPVILNVSTDMASNSYQARPDAGIHVVAYNTSKAAANSYTIALAHELKSEGFKVNAVTPGFTSTKLNFFGRAGRLRKMALRHYCHGLY
jgi:NAD(P)-dependent dehydrogenase (short-subunit alcohol dehydrogenase family)